MAPQPRLEGKVAIVTGGASGFGKGIATKFVEEGAQILIADLSEEAGQGVAKELGCAFVVGDVTKREDWERLLKEAIDKFGKLDIVSFLGVFSIPLWQFLASVAPACSRDIGQILLFMVITDSSG